MQNNLPIGVFDSGVGGLTVLQALQQRLPQESFVYFGDTARLPYGTKSPQTVIQYAIHAATLLQQQSIKCLVVACNTASSVSLDALRAAFPTLPIIGVLEPGARAAHAASLSHTIGLLATEATVKAGAYHRALLDINPQTQLIAQGCSVFVALAEEGWIDDEITAAVIDRYVSPLLAEHPRLDCLLLGCTHFPVLLPAMLRRLPRHITIVDSAAATAEEVESVLTQHQLHTQAQPVATRFLVSDSPERFSKVAKRFLNQDIASGQIEWIDGITVQGGTV